MLQSIYTYGTHTRGPGVSEEFVDTLLPNVRNMEGGEEQTIAWRPATEALFLIDPPDVPLLRALWSLLVGIWDRLKGSWGVLVYRFRYLQLLNSCFYGGPLGGTPSNKGHTIWGLYWGPLICGSSQTCNVISVVPGAWR